MHNGSFATLKDVIEYYDGGGGFKEARNAGAGLAVHTEPRAWRRDISQPCAASATGSRPDKAFTWP